MVTELLPSLGPKWVILLEHQQIDLSYCRNH